MNNYVGKCVVKRPSGEIHSVVMADSLGNSITLPPNEYQERSIVPPLEQLPECDNFHPKIKSKP